ncbi:MAG: class I SAM-dependent methyltransferase [Acidobacteriota bacterium]|nr:class I SAM-dependent methyltransferase [Acidobacteriota bacterium]
MSNWNALAELDPLWTILSDPHKKFGKWDSAEFFDTGKHEAERVLAMCNRQGFRINYGRLLDFGCGVGRMTRGFSAEFRSCTGIDVSETMVGLARQFNSDCPHCEFIASESAALPFANNSFDFIFSVLVLQHLPTRDSILNCIAEFVRVAKDGGAIVFQLPIQVPARRRIQLRRRLWSLLSALGISQRWQFRSLGLTPIQINGIARAKVERFLAERGARVHAVERYDAQEGEFHSNYYLAVKSK